MLIRNATEGFNYSVFFVTLRTYTDLPIIVYWHLSNDSIVEPLLELKIETDTGISSIIIWNGEVIEENRTWILKMNPHSETNITTSFVIDSSIGDFASLIWTETYVIINDDAPPSQPTEPPADLPSRFYRKNLTASIGSPFENANTTVTFINTTTSVDSTFENGTDASIVIENALAGCYVEIPQLCIFWAGTLPSELTWTLDVKNSTFAALLQAVIIMGDKEYPVIWNGSVLTYSFSQILPGNSTTLLSIRLVGDIHYGTTAELVWLESWRILH